MLHGKVDPMKGYEELLVDAIGQIPMYSSEWTNYNPSDPGITMLENLTAFHLAQMENIETISEDARRNLLKLVGFTAGENRPSRIPLQMPDGADDVTLPAHKKMAIGSLIFETGKPIRLRKRNLVAVYTLTRGILKDVTKLLSPQLPISIAPFGQEPIEGDGLCMEFEALPPTGKALTLYVQTEDRWARNPWVEDDIPPFAILSWQLWTAEGWIAIQVLDKTGFYLKNGKITLVMPTERPVTNEHGNYEIRCILTQNNYDTPPHIHAIFDNVFEVRQRNTLAASFAKGGNRITIRSEMVDDDIVQVFVREKKTYRRYQPAPMGDVTGRFYRVKQRREGKMVLEFDPEAYGYGPDKGPDGIRVVCYTEESVNLRKLGQVYGYDNQEIPLENITQIVAEGFQVIAETVDKDGVAEYGFYPPNLTDEDTLGYRLRSQDGVLDIYNPGLDGGCQLFLCDCAVTMGDAGNLRAGNRLTTIPKHPTSERPMSFLSLGLGAEGSSFERTKDLAERFALSLRNPLVAVTAEDYEQLVMKTPGLCIETVKATVSVADNLVQIVVKPRSNQEFPRLTDLYIKQIQNHIEHSRLITTQVAMKQPRYIPIHLQVKLQVSQMAQTRREQIHGVLVDVFSGILKEGKLGERMSLERLYRAVQGLDDVEYLYEIIPSFGDPTAIRFDGTWLHLQPDCIAYLGDIQMKLIW